LKACTTHGTFTVAEPNRNPSPFSNGPLSSIPISLSPTQPWRRRTAIWAKINWLSSTQKQAFERRDRTSEREKFYIESHCHNSVTQDLMRTVETYELWMKAYPRDDIPHNNIGVTYAELGQHEKGLHEAKEAVRLDSNNVLAQQNVAFGFMALNRFDEAKIGFGEVLARRPDDVLSHLGMYITSAILEDNAAMQQQVAWASGKPDARAYSSGCKHERLCITVGLPRHGT
jgi:tetratricopeptide (TPR) repeat protein